jgi:hypothetical protein
MGDKASVVVTPKKVEIAARLRRLAMKWTTLP